MSHDPVTKPEHYDLGLGGLEVIDVMVALGWATDYLKANALKYLMRHEKKGNPLQDLRKARYCLDRLIQMMEAEAGGALVVTVDGAIGLHDGVCRPGRHLRWEGEEYEADPGPAWESARERPEGESLR